MQTIAPPPSPDRAAGGPAAAPPTALGFVVTLVAVAVAVTVALGLTLVAPAASAQEGAAGGSDGVDAVSIPDAITAENVPPIPRSLADELRPWGSLRSARVSDWHPSERRMLIATRFGETTQLHEVVQPLGMRKQLTFYDEPVQGGLYRPGRGQQILFAVNEAGAENYQLFLLDRDAGTTRRLSDGVHRYQSPTWTKDGSLLAYSSNARNGRDFDLYVQNPDEPGSERLVGEVSGAFFVADWDPAGERLLVVEYISSTDARPWILDIESGEFEALLDVPEGEDVAVQGADFSPDGGAVYLLTDRSGEFLNLERLDLASRTWTNLTAPIDWNVESFDISDDGRVVAFLTNEDGISVLHALDAVSGETLATPDLPPGVAGGLGFRPGSREVAFTLDWARSPDDVWSWEVGGEGLTRWTESEVGGLDPSRFAVPELVRFPTFDRLPPDAEGEEQGPRRTIPAFVYRPDPQRHPGPRPVYIDIHGGPESQFRPSFRGSSNYWIDELGITVIHPNVRGSSGYGETYLKLDNARLREDSVKDIGALLDWIATQEDLDASRVMVGGGSYGGYMSLATMTFYSDRLRAGFSYVGISDFVTFLENTADYRRDLRRVEYGDESDPDMRRFLKEISPLGRADRIRVPMLVAQGANDPRVPAGESRQVVEAVRENGQTVWYVEAADEGHGFAKKSNSDYLRLVMIEFARRHLLGQEGSAE